MAIDQNGLGGVKFNSNRKHQGSLKGGIVLCCPGVWFLGVIGGGGRHEILGFANVLNVKSNQNLHNTAINSLNFENSTLSPRGPW